MYQINSNFSISRLNNPEFCAFFLNVQKAITNSDASMLGITELLPSYNAKLQELVDRVYVSQGSEFTAAMKAADDRRCLIFRRIRLRLQMVEVAEQNEALLACQDVVRTHLLSKYVASVTSRAYQERSSILQGFLLDLQAKLDEDAIAALGLAEDMLALRDANNTFIAAYAQRTAEKAEGNTGVTARMRDEMFDIYLQLIFIVQYLANSTATDNAEKATACQEFIAIVNVLLSDAKKRLEQRLGGEVADPEGEGGSEGGTDGTGSSTGTDGGTEGATGGSTTGTGTTGGSAGSSFGATDGSSDNSGSTPSNSSNPSTPSGSGVVNGDDVSF